MHGQRETYQSLSVVASDFLLVRLVMFLFFSSCFAQSSNTAFPSLSLFVPQILFIIKNVRGLVQQVTEIIFTEHLAMAIKGSNSKFVRRILDDHFGCNIGGDRLNNYVRRMSG